MCTAPDCSRPAYCRGLCSMHYQRVKAHGSFDLPSRNLPSVDSVLDAGHKPGSGGCWVWQRALNADGYPLIWRGNRAYLFAHRVSWERVNGPIPDGLVIDHVCRNRACVNPEHLEPVTISENVLRGVGITATNARKRFCPRGHPYDEENTRIRPSGARECKECHRESNRARRRREREDV